MKKEYDLICSLGGNCSVAHNLIERGLREYSLPFDWCYIKNDKPIEYLKEGFKNNFKNFLLKENLVPLTGDEYNNTHTNRAQYKDIYTGYYFVNHFTKGMDFDKDYEVVYKKIHRRLDRLQEKLKKGTNILFILSISFHIDDKKIEELYACLKEIYPDKNIEFIAMMFNCPEDKVVNLNCSVRIMKYSRNYNYYDYNKTNYEWAFLDDITVKPTHKITNSLFKISKIKKGYTIHILSKISTLFHLKLYLMGLRLNFCIGKIRE